MPGVVFQTIAPHYRELYKNRWLVMCPITIGGIGCQLIDFPFTSIPRLDGRTIRFLSLRLAHIEVPSLAHEYTPFVTVQAAAYSAIAPTLTYTGVAATKNVMQFDLGHFDSHPEYGYEISINDGNISLGAESVRVHLDADMVSDAIIAANMLIEVIDRPVINPYASEVRDTPGLPTRVEIVKPAFRFPFVRQ